MSFRLALRESASRHILEREKRYDVMVNDRKVDELYFNMQSYRGALMDVHGNRISLPFVRVPDYVRVDPAPLVLKAVCEAILRCQAIRLRIAGETGSEWRNVSGHAIVEALGRLHLRGFDHDCDRFDDIPLTRVMDTTCPDRGIRYVGADSDHAWRETEDILVELNPDAGISRARLAVRDYQLRGETMSRRIAVPRALSGLLVEELHGANPGTGHEVPPVLVKRPD